MPPEPLTGLSSRALEGALGAAPVGPDLTRYFLVCGGLLVLVLLFAWGFRRVFARALAARAARRSLRVVDVLPLGGSKRLLVVSCYERAFLVGQGEKELCAIAELDGELVHGPPHEPERPPGSAPPAAPVPRERLDPARFAELVRAAQGEVTPAPRRPVLEDGRGVLG